MQNLLLNAGVLWSSWCPSWIAKFQLKLKATTILNGSLPFWHYYILFLYQLEEQKGCHLSINVFNWRIKLSHCWHLGAPIKKHLVEELIRHSLIHFINILQLGAPSNFSAAIAVNYAGCNTQIRGIELGNAVIDI